MRWQTGRRSRNVEDRRGLRISRRAGAGGGVAVIVFALVAVYLGVDPEVVLQSIPETRTDYTETAPVPAGQEELADFVSVIVADTEDTWSELFARGGGIYSEPRLVLFSGAVESACGMARSASGPFYCPSDRKVYIDLDFYRELKDRFRVPGDFAQAYVIAHEIGHHVQNLRGVLGEVQEAQRRLDKTGARALSVRAELQADCLAGVWAYHAHRARNILESGDIEEGINAAGAIGDDRIQRESRGYVVPDTFTHGTSAQRVSWFRRGLERGDVNECDTFGEESL